MEENMTLLIDTETRDLVLDENGFFEKIYNEDTKMPSGERTVRFALEPNNSRALYSRESSSSA